VGSSRRRCLSSSGAVTSRALSWFAAWLRAFTAEWRADLKVRIISTLPSPLLGSPRASPARTALAAACASRWDRTCLCAGGGGAWVSRPPPPKLPQPSGGGQARLRSCSGPLYSGTPHRAKALRPTKESLIASRCGRYLQLTQAPAQLVQSHRHVHVEVRVHTQDHPIHAGGAFHIVPKIVCTPAAPFNAAVIVSSPSGSRVDSTTVRGHVPLGKLLLGHALRPWAVTKRRPGSTDGSLPRHHRARG
jgi:hypothetical protein